MNQQKTHGFFVSLQDIPVFCLVNLELFLFKGHLGRPLTAPLPMDESTCFLIIQATDISNCLNSLDLWSGVVFFAMERNQGTTNKFDITATCFLYKM